MTSKEIIKDLLEMCDEDEWYETETKFLKPSLETILKDLEILEILKPYLKETVEIKKDSHLLSMRFKAVEFVTWDMATNEDATKIKIIERWLENDK